MDMRDIQKMFSQSSEEPEGPKILLEAEIDLLRSNLKDFNKKHDFRLGMIVRQKSNFYRLPSDNGISIVVDMLPDLIINEKEETGSTYYRDRYDMLIGSWSSATGAFLIFHVDSRRFEPVPQDELP